MPAIDVAHCTDHSLMVGVHGGPGLRELGSVHRLAADQGSALGSDLVDDPDVSGVPADVVHPRVHLRARQRSSCATRWDHASPEKSAVRATATPVRVHHLNARARGAEGP